MWSVEDEGIMIQRPVVEPLHNTRPSANIYIELATELGVLTGPGGLNDALNGLYGPVFDLNKAYRNAREYVEDYVARCGGADQDLVWKQGHRLRRIPAPKRYLPTCLEGYRLPFYCVWFMTTGARVRDYMEKHNAFQHTVFDERMFFEYAPLPFWHPSVIEEEPAEFDLYVTNWKSSLGTVASGTLPATNAWLMEVAERDPYVTKILLNRETACAKGLRDGEVVWVESPHGRMKGRLKVTETIHPEVIGTIGCFGHYTDHAVSRGRGPGNFNILLGSGFRYMGPTSLQAETTARAKIYAA
jgi:anaerobic selenocysteine-containing dehydrogenase